MDSQTQEMVDSILESQPSRNRTTSSSDVRTPASKKQGPQIQKWCFTLNNPTDQELKTIQNYMTKNCKYGVYELEHAVVAEDNAFTVTSQTPHVQGYLNLLVKNRLTALKKAFPRAHFEPAKGTQQQNYAYCTKEWRKNPEVPYFLHDKMPADTEDSDSMQPKATLEDALDQCQTLSEFMLKFPLHYCRHKNGVTALLLQKESLQDKPLPNVTWLWGETGTGKTRHCISFCTANDLPYWISGEKLNWFDGYCGQPVAIIDDFRKGDCTFKYLLRLLDRYRISVPIKGGFVSWVPKYIFITCPYEPRQYFKYEDSHGAIVDREDIGQLMRRITHVVHVGVPNQGAVLETTEQERNREAGIDDLDQAFGPDLAFE